MDRTSCLSVRLPRELKDWLTAKAKSEGRSINMQAVQALKAARSGDQQTKQETQA